MNKIRLKFLGAIGTVTGSCTLLEYSEYNDAHYYLIDAGAYQNEFNKDFEVREKILRKHASKIEIIFITHAHLDHIGLLPKLIEWGFNGIIYATKATVELTKIMLEDAMRINGISRVGTIERLNFYEFDKNHGEDTFKGFGKKYAKIKKDFSVTILRSSHILGSCTWFFRWTENEYESEVLSENKEWKYIYFTGDIGPIRDKFYSSVLFKEHQIPFPNKNKTVIMESTYGNVIRDKEENTYEKKIKKLEEIVITNIENNRLILIPVFALDRAQQLLLDLYYIAAKHRIDNKTWFHRMNVNWKNLIFDKNKNNILSSICNILSLEEKQLRKLKNLIDNVFSNDALFQDISSAKQEELISLLEERKNIKIGIKSPLIKKINAIYLKHLTDDVFSQKENKLKYKYLSDEFLNRFGIEHQSEDVKKVLGKCFSDRTENGNVIISASGMCDEGAVLDLLPKYLRDENATIILTGYQAKDTNGFLLKNYSDGKYDDDNQKSKISLNNIDIKLSDIKCKIEDLSSYYSGHADQEQLVNYILESNQDSVETTILITHGSEEARKELKNSFDKKGENISILLPEFNKWLDIVSKEYVLTEIDKNSDLVELDKAHQYKHLNVDELHIYFPIEYNENKLRKIIEFIQES